MGKINKLYVLTIFFVLNVPHSLWHENKETFLLPITVIKITTITTILNASMAGILLVGYDNVF